MKLKSALHALASARSASGQHSASAPAAYTEYITMKTYKPAIHPAWRAIIRTTITLANPAGKSAQNV